MNIPKDTVEIVEYWNSINRSYEVMTRENFDKKMKGLEYEVLRKSNIQPWENIDHKRYEWEGLARHIYFEEFKNKFGDYREINCKCMFCFKRDPSLAWSFPCTKGDGHCHHNSCASNFHEKGFICEYHNCVTYRKPSK